MEENEIKYEVIEGMNEYGCIINEIPFILSDYWNEENINNLKELWKENSILILYGEKQMTPGNQLKLLRLVQEMIAKKNDIEDDYSYTKFEYLNKTVEQLKHENFLLQIEVNDSKLTISHLQDDVKLERQKLETSQEQLTSFHELEEYSAGLREECSKLEESLAQLKVRLEDMERSYASLNKLNDELQNEKNKLTKSLKEKDSKIESLEKELWSKHLKGHSPQQLNHPKTIRTPDITPNNLSIVRKLDSELSETDVTIKLSPSTPISQIQENITINLESDSVISPGDVNIVSPKLSTTPPISSSSSSSSSSSALSSSLSSSSTPLAPQISGVITTTAATITTTTTTTVVNSYHENFDGKNTNEQENEPPLNPNLTRMIQEMEENNRRFASRIKFLDTRLEVKEEAIRKLTSRIEEVIIERDSFREAMKELLVGMNTIPDNDNSLNQLNRSGSMNPNEEISTKSVSPQSRKKKNNESNNSNSLNNSISDIPNWQNAVSVDSFKGVMGLLSSSSSNQSSNNSSNNNNYNNNNNNNNNGNGNGNNNSKESAQLTNALQNIQILESENQKLKKEIDDLNNQLKKLQQRTEDLEKSLEQSENATKEAEKYADEEFKLLSLKIEEAIKERNDAFEKLESSKADNERLQKQITRSTMKYTNYEEKLSTLNQRIDHLEKELKETKANAINPEEFTALQDRVQELMGESKHWQQKAMSLSKEMQRSMSVQMELNRVQQEMITIKARMEELEAERTAFRDAMQQAISVSSNPHDSASLSPRSESLKTGWLSNLI